MSKLDELERLVSEAKKEPTYAQRIATENRAKMALYHSAPSLLACARLVRDMDRIGSVSEFDSITEFSDCLDRARRAIADLEGE